VTYLVINLPSDPSARTARVAFERAQGRVYQRPDGSHVLARETWPPMTHSLPTLPSERTGWIEVLD